MKPLRKVTSAVDYGGTPLFLMPEFLTVKEAAALVGKSPSSIRRIIYPILENDSHPDRGQIWPGVEEATALRMQGESFPWKLTQELLNRMVPPETATDRSEGSQRHAASSAEGELLAMLRGELAIKNTQIAEQAELMKGLSERLREGNILMGTLQKQLALGDGREKNSEASAEVVVTKTPTKVKTMKTVKTEKTDKPEKGSSKSEKQSSGFWSTLFSR